MEEELTTKQVQAKIEDLKQHLKIWKGKLKEMNEKEFNKRMDIPTKEKVQEKLRERYGHLSEDVLFKEADRIMNKKEFRANPRAYIRKAIEKRGDTEELRIPVRNVLASLLGFHSS